MWKVKVLIKIFHKWFYLEREIFFKTNVEMTNFVKYMRFLSYLLRYDYFKLLYWKMLFLLYSLFFPLPIGGRGRKTCFFYRSSKTKSFLIIERQKGRAERKYDIAKLLSISYIFYNIMLEGLLSSQLPLHQYREDIIGFKQRILYISKSTINVCWKNNYRMKI